MPEAWWRHQMEAFSALLALCEGNPPVPGRFPSQRPVTRRFDVFFDLRLNKRLSKQSRRRWFKTPSRSLWRHCNDGIGTFVWRIRTISLYIHIYILLSGVPDLWDRNKILSGGDLSHHQVPHCIRVLFYFVWFVFIHHNFQFYFELCTYCNILDIYLS